MNAGQRVLLGFGVVGVLLGLAAYVSPGIAGAVFVDDFYVVIVGAIAIAQAGRIARDARDGPIDRAETGDPELVDGIPTPGSEFDEALASASSVHQIEGRREVERRLRRAAAAVLQRRRDCSPEEADERLEAGTWTDDALAASFFSERVRRELSWRTRARIRVSGQSSFGLRAERAADEIERIWRDDA